MELLRTRRGLGCLGVGEWTHEISRRSDDQAAWETALLCPKQFHPSSLGSCTLSRKKRSFQQNSAELQNLSARSQRQARVALAKHAAPVGNVARRGRSVQDIGVGGADEAG